LTFWTFDLGGVQFATVECWLESGDYVKDIAVNFNPTNLTNLLVIDDKFAKQETSTILDQKDNSLILASFNVYERASLVTTHPTRTALSFIRPLLSGLLREHVDELLDARRAPVALLQAFIGLAGESGEAA
jgi:hypothetical protein